MALRQNTYRQRIKNWELRVDKYLFTLDIQVFTYKSRVNCWSHPYLITQTRFNPTGYSVGISISIDTLSQARASSNLSKNWVSKHPFNFMGFFYRLLPRQLRNQIGSQHLSIFLCAYLNAHWNQLLNSPFLVLGINDK